DSINHKSWSSLKTAVQESQLLASDGAADDYFGISVSLSGNRALIGAPYDDNNGIKSGSAYVFELQSGSWVETAKLTANDGAAMDNFGWSVSLSGNRALIGARLDDDHGVNSGSAYVFELQSGSWGETVKLTAADGATGDNFGLSVSLFGDRALIGSIGDNDNGSDSGSAYVFELQAGNWAEFTKLVASDGAAGDYFGVSVSLSGDRASIGAWGDDDHGSKSGSAYVFDLNGVTWTETAKLTADDGAADDRFGLSVSLSGNR